MPKLTSFRSEMDEVIMMNQLNSLSRFPPVPVPVLNLKGGDSPSSVSVELDNPEPEKRRSHDFDGLLLSALYAKLLVVLGIGLPLSEVISPLIPSSFYVGFYLYLYFGCVVFLIYSYLFLMRKKGLVFHTLFNGKNKNFSRNLYHMQPDKSCGSFYLRVGAIVFGIGSMIYSGLEFVQFFELDPDSSCYSVVYAIAPMSQLIFTFAQLYFIFLNAKMRTYKYKNVARFGLMHMVATNLCNWFLSVIQESKFEIQRLTYPNILDDHDSGHSMASLINLSHAKNNLTIFQDMFETTTMPYKDPLFPILNPMIPCRRMRVLGQLVQNISPLLFPCSIQYSVICAAICYIMWKNMSRLKDVPAPSSGPGPVNNNVPEASASQVSRQHHYSVDCTGSIKGLFTGILILVLVIMSVILYFVLINKREYRSLAFLEGHVSEIAIYVLTIPIPIVAMLKIRKFHYHPHKNVELDNILLIFAQVGIYLFSIFSIISGHLSPDGDAWLVVTGASVTRLVQATIQSVFILDASHRTARTGSEAHKTPARELITFLLVCNFAMWIISTLETDRTDSHPLQLKFYGFWGWTIISRFCTPLVIFFRFHSTVCLCEIWKRLYKYNR